MKSLFHHIDRVKQKPHHIRRQVAFTAAFIIAAVIGFIWLTGSVVSGAFAINGSNFAESTGASVTAVPTDTSSDDSDLAGVAAAGGAQSQAPAQIEIVNASTTTPPQPQPTIIPF